MARADHPRANGDTSLVELAQENWIVAPHGTPTRRYFEELLVGQGLTPPAQTCEIVTFHLAEQMIRHSDAIGLLTYSAEKLGTVRAGLKVLPIELPDNVREIGLTFRKHQVLAVAQQAFLKILFDERQNSVGQSVSSTAHAAAQ